MVQLKRVHTASRDNRSYSIFTPLTGTFRPRAARGTRSSRVVAMTSAVQVAAKHHGKRNDHEAEDLLPEIGHDCLPSYPCMHTIHTCNGAPWLILRGARVSYSSSSLRRRIAKIYILRASRKSASFAASLGPCMVPAHSGSSRSLSSGPNDTALLKLRA